MGLVPLALRSAFLGLRELVLPLLSGLSPSAVGERPVLRVVKRDALVGVPTAVPWWWAIGEAGWLMGLL